MKWLIPPLLAALCAMLMGLLSLVWPLASILPSPWNWTGIVVVAAGMALAGIGRLQFTREGANIWTFDAPTRLVTGGAFRFTRNPMYLGFTIALFGWGMLLGAASPFIVWLAFVGICNFWYIPFEENRMLESFGQGYADYRAKTRRWL